ncbi:hypothetical protein HBH70_137460 [Parastagonospora nodorum]|nr:hypothetical protein HBH51_129840 [Parastagonospora nodorum]KAH4026280.1 hypothetical protein HBI09_150910 [Parastagonospora nodorum]KAH4259616.1 hypothetical protein HBI03_137260 [Parastagonospora nodorum]KAH4281878.1 hypothetical protein HBI04_044530 [Parastagonospora nodorum]KAH4851137.1 hypothetical protein HBH75_128840 [Parastagonospora nodorum]
MHSNVNPEPHGRWGGPRWVTWGRGGCLLAFVHSLTSHILSPRASMYARYAKSSPSSPRRNLLKSLPSFHGGAWAVNSGAVIPKCTVS